MNNKAKKLSIAKLKEKFLKYFAELPVQALAANYIGRDQDTISLWKSRDEGFSEAIDNLRAEYALKNIKQVRSKEWILERVIRDQFRPPQLRTDITSGGKPIPILGGITNDVHTNNSDSQAITTEKKD